VRVDTAGGPVVLASDATHFYANLQEDRPFAIVHSLPGMYAAFDRVRALAGGDDDRIVPGHDPLVLAPPRRGTGTRGAGRRSHPRDTLRDPRPE
jgi:glyoxylase-like metal-dependent hydrolase (beta-lactamase superfamily II)